MKELTKQKLRMAKIYCDNEDKSTEFMLEFMQNIAGVNLDCVLKYLKKQGWEKA